VHSGAGRILRGLFTEYTKLRKNSSIIELVEMRVIYYRAHETTRIRHSVGDDVGILKKNQSPKKPIRFPRFKTIILSSSTFSKTEFVYINRAYRHGMGAAVGQTTIIIII